jgi:anti-sigma regulatory factor (Ser/Thr protein kinase)
MDGFILVIPSSGRFLRLARAAVDRLTLEAGLPSSAVFELGLALTEACNLVAQAHGSGAAGKVVSINGSFERGELLFTIDDGGNSRAGRKFRSIIERRQLPFPGNLALRTVRGLCDEVSLSSGITGGLRIQLKKSLGDAAPAIDDEGNNADYRQLQQSQQGPVSGGPKPKVQREQAD